MRLICILFLLLILIIPSTTQNPLEELLAIEENEAGKRFVTSKFPVEYFDKNGKGNFYYFEAGVLFIPKIKKEKRIDTITLEMIIEEDSIVDVETKHSLHLPEGKRIFPKRTDRNCISASNGYSLQLIDLNSVLRNEKIPFKNYSQEEIKSFVNKYNKENHTREYKINMPQKIKWLSIDSLDLEGMEKLELGVMPSTFKDSEGNIFVVFSDGYYTKYREMLCSGMGRLSIDELSSIQKALLEKGFDVSITNYMDNKTKTALIQFQKQNNLPVGYLHVETFEALGLEDLMYK